MPAEFILETAGKLQIELIVLGVRGTRFPRVAAHLPGPTAYDVVSHARCPVLVIRGDLHSRNEALHPERTGEGSKNKTMQHPIELLPQVDLAEACIRQCEMLIA